ncbi:MAG: carbohydrate binding domain-containing protein [bacterium]
MVFLPIITSVFTVTVLSQNIVFDEEDMIKNGSFEIDSDGDGMADLWQFSGDNGVHVSWQRDIGFNSPFSQKIVCTSFKHISPASHVMICQLNSIKLEKGHWYKISFSAKQEGIKGQAVHVAISNTKSWSNCGLEESFRVLQNWRQYSFNFQAKQTITDNVRLQFWYNTTGAFWLDNVQLVPTEPVLKRFTEILPNTNSKNLLPNSSFECGKSGWGSIADLPGWGGNLNQLIGSIDYSESIIGSHSLKIELNNRTIPIYYFDYFSLYRVPVKCPLLANRGWITVEPNVDYTLSAYMKADSEKLKGILSVRQAFHRTLHQNIDLTTKWKRYSFTFKPQTNQIFIAIGDDLTKSELDSGTIWIDAVQLEKGNIASDYHPRADIEVGFAIDRLGNIFHYGEQPVIRSIIFNEDDSLHSVLLNIQITDFDDKVIRKFSVPIDSPSKQSIEIPIYMDIEKKGFYRFNCIVKPIDNKASAEAILTRSLRFAIIEPYEKKDSVFGMNHAYPWEHLLDLSKEIGLLWFRDWSLKWQDVEPEKGKFNFSEPDIQINRVLERELNVLPLLPFPSSNWSSSSEQKTKASEQYPENRELMAYMPRDLEEFADYVRATVNYYKKHLNVWEILNEPIYTDYALPKNKGYVVKDYVHLLEVAYKAVKESDPEAFVIGGIASGVDNYVTEFIKLGGLNFVDVLNLHIYPGLTSPEQYDQPMAELRELMRKYDMDKPIWFTEGSYYADDDTPVEPFSEWLKPLESEIQASEWQIKFNTILMSYGVKKIIYHSGTPGSINNESLSGIFFEWAGEPRKMLVTQSAMSNIFADNFKPIGKVKAPEKVKAYGFESNGKTIVIAWMEEGAKPTKIFLEGKSCNIIDLQGNVIKSNEIILTERPIYLVFSSFSDQL